MKRYTSFFARAGVLCLEVGGGRKISEVEARVFCYCQRLFSLT